MGRVQTNLELGLDWSVDVGASVIHQEHFRNSLRFAGTSYAKTVGGADLTVFWNPVESNFFQGADFGVEYLTNRQDYEVLVEERLRQAQLRPGRVLHLGALSPQSNLGLRRHLRELRERHRAWRIDARAWAVS